MFLIDNSILLVIDVQGKLASLVDNKKKVFANIQSLIQAAKILEVPVIYTEQAPEKIGETIPEIKKYLEGLNPIIKSAFSCCRENAFVNELKSYDRNQIIIAGIETHVCIYQTAAELKEEGYEVKVIADAVSSRTPDNKAIAIDAMRALNIGISCTEMILTELLKTSKHDNFKKILSLIK